MKADGAVLSEGFPVPMGGVAYHDLSNAAIEMAESYLRDRKRVLPCAVWLTGQYGVKNLYVGVPCVIGAGGAERVVEVDLNAKERALFDKSVAAVRSLMDTSKKILAKAGKGGAAKK